jgi:signal transduction histidine kinase
VSGTGDWTTHQLTEFVAFVASFRDVDNALNGAVERAAEALEAEVGVAVLDGAVRASVGFGHDGCPEAAILALGTDLAEHTVDLPGVGPGRAALAPLGDETDGLLVVVRASDEPFATREVNLLRAMARVLAQQVRMLRALAEERALRERSERQSAERAGFVSLLTERQRLLERLGRIQRSISHRAPLQEVLDAITLGAHELLGDQVCGLRLVDPDNPAQFVLASYCGISDDDIEHARRGPVGQGAGGRAIAEDRLVIIDDYAADPNPVPVFLANRMTTAMAAPVHENGRVVGSLVTASYVPGRRYGMLEQEALAQLAQHASLALTDAKTVEAMREAQRAKDMFLAMVSHELKTPLTVIMGTLRTLENHGGALDETLVREIVAAAYARGEELRRLIDRLLRGARAELAGARREAALQELVGRAVDGFQHLRRISVDVEGDTDLLVDTVAFADVVGILVENAIAHAPADAPVAVTARPCGNDVVVEVTNPGSIPADVDPATLFQPFHRGGDARSSGVGLGLYIAQRLADSMAATIDVASAGGTVTFTLRVPRFPQPPLIPSPLAVRDQSLALAGQRDQA